MSYKEAGRLQVLQQIMDRQVSGPQAVELLGISLRQVRRLIAKFRVKGPMAVVHGLRGRPAKNRISDTVQRKILQLATKTYAGFNFTHLHEKLTEVEQIRIGQETLRLILRRNGIASPRKHRPPKHRKRRDRMPQPGLMVLTDGSTHDWLETRGPRLCLLGIIDDASSEVIAATFRDQEDSAGYLTIFKRMARSHGLPVAAYTDRHTIFVSYKKHLSLEEQLQGKPEPTQVGRALDELGIRLLLSNSPQARGRVERLWGTFQDRLVSELRLAKASSRDQAEDLLQLLIKDHNRRFAKIPADPAPAWRKLPTGTNLERIFCLKYPRVVANDNTVRIEGRIFDIPPGPQRRTYARHTVDLCQLPNGAWKIYLGQRVIASFPSDGSPVRACRRPRQMVTFSLGN